MNNSYDYMKALTAQQIEIIHNKTIEILQTVGMRFNSEEALAIFRKNGFTIEGETVFFTEKQVMDAVTKAPSHFTLHSRYGSVRKTMIGKEAIAFTTNSGAPFILDYDGTLRESGKKDYYKFLKLSQQLDPVALHRELIFTTKDVPAPNATLYQTLLQLCLTDKPVNVSSEQCIELLSLACGRDKETMRADAQQGIVYGAGTVSILSPLTLEESQAERCIAHAQWGVPPYLTPMPMGGMTAPVTLTGSLVLMNAEILGCLVLTQLIHPGTPVIYGIIATITDMKTACAPTAPVEYAIITNAGIQMARYYELPTRTDVGVSDSCANDFQAGAESAFHMANGIRSGAHLMPGLGSLQSRCIGSLEKLVLDCDIAASLERMMRPLGFEEKDIALEEIKKVGIGGSFITEKHTYQHFREEIFSPDIFVRTTHEKWSQDGAQDAHTRAHEKVEELLASYTLPDIPASLVQDLIQYANNNFENQDFTIKEI